MRKMNRPSGRETAVTWNIWIAGAGGLESPGITCETFKIPQAQLFRGRAGQACLPTGRRGCVQQTLSVFQAVSDVDVIKHSKYRYDVCGISLALLHKPTESPYFRV